MRMILPAHWSWPAKSLARAEMNTPSVVLVEDNAMFSTVLARSLQRRGYRVGTAPSLTQLHELLLQGSPTYAVVNLNLRTASGLPCIRALRSADAQTVVVALSGLASSANAAAAVSLGAVSCLAKLPNSDDVEAAFGSRWRASIFFLARPLAIVKHRPCPTKGGVIASYTNS